MNRTEFENEIRKPYQQLWKCIVLVQQACSDNSEEYWSMYGREVERLCKQYETNPFGYRCGRFMLDAAEDIKRMNVEGAQNV